jgi:hypothetical protein
VLVQGSQVILGEVPCIEDRELGVDAVRLQFRYRPDEGGNVYDVPGDLPEEQGQIGALLDYIDQSHLI